MDKQNGASGMETEVDEWITSEDRRREEWGREEDKGEEQGGKERNERRAWRARLRLQGDASEEAERDMGVAAGMVAPLLRLHQKRRQWWKSLCELWGLHFSVHVCVSVWLSGGLGELGSVCVSHGRKNVFAPSLMLPGQPVVHRSMANDPAGKSCVWGFFHVC